MKPSRFPLTLFAGLGEYFCDHVFNLWLTCLLRWRPKSNYKISFNIPHTGHHTISQCVRVVAPMPKQNNNFNRKRGKNLRRKYISPVTWTKLYAASVFSYLNNIRNTLFNQKSPFHSVKKLHGGDKQTNRDFVTFKLNRPRGQLGKIPMRIWFIKRKIGGKVNILPNFN